MTGITGPHGERILIERDAESALRAGADRIAVTLASVAAARGRVDVATTGGSAAPGLYRFLSSDPLRDAIPWSSVHVWWGDDRFVPREHPLSNVKPLDDILLDIGGASAGTAGGPPGVGLPVDNLHPFRTSEAIGAGRSNDECAAELAAELAAVVEVGAIDVVDGFPALDLVLLGMGPDGHLLSVFPGSVAFDSADWALGIPAPTHVEPHVARVTLNPAIVTSAREVLMVTTGAGKADVLARILLDDGAQPGGIRELPARIARHARATWIIDEAAAAKLPR